MNMNWTKFEWIWIGFELAHVFNWIHAKKPFFAKKPFEFEYIQWIWIGFEYFQFESDPYPLALHKKGLEETISF